MVTMEYKELISNEYYSLSEIFATPNRKIIIPDFQRDFCWGDQTHGVPPYFDIVTGFLDTLVEEFKSDKESDHFLGKIDVYEHPKNHIYLTDGQQRLTTLYLIIGMLYRKEQEIELKKKLKNCLIFSLEDNNDDQEPYLQYSVRESTVFFLRDLVTHFFLAELSIDSYRIDYQQAVKNKKGNKIDTLLSFAVKNQAWYFSEYDLDPSIISMLSALSIIEEKLKNIDEDFSDFVIEKIKIQYYDVIDKQRGEERFVIINTTGKSLTLTENVKPIMLGTATKAKFAKEWEERETFFWQNRILGKENIADYGVDDFLNWCFQIIDQQDEFDIIKKAKRILKEKNNDYYLECIDAYYKALNKVLICLENDKYQDQFKFINENKEVKGILQLRGLSKDKQQNILLPLLSFINKFGNETDECYQFLRRLRKNYFDQKWQERNNHYVDWRYILKIIDNSTSAGDILVYQTSDDSLKSIQKVKVNEWFNEEEQLKHKLYDKNELLIKWEDHPDFMGDLTPLFNVSEDKTDLDELKKFFNIYSSIDPNIFTFSEKIELKNIYRLFLYINNGSFEHRSVGGEGYCMLVNSEKKLFLQDNFDVIWKAYKEKTDDEMYLYFQTKLKKYFSETILKGEKIDNIIYDTNTLGHYERVQLWSVLEFLYTKEEIYFNSNICQFWNYPNLVSISNDIDKVTDNYSIGNLLLGTSYYNNKTGWINFNNYPLMKELSKHRTKDNDISKRTIEIGEILKNFLN